MAKNLIKTNCDIILTLISLYSIFSVCLLLGFELNFELYNLLIDINGFVSIIFILQELVRIYLYKNIKLYIKERLFECLIIATVGLCYLFQDNLLQFVKVYFPGLHFSKIIIIYLSIIQSILFFFQLIRFFRSSTKFTNISFSSTQVFMISFLIPILLGSLIFKLPKATIGNISWVDALFLSFSSFCVTGLSTIDIQTQLTPLGKFFLMLFVQIGALGIVSLSLSIGHIFSGSLGLKEKLVISEILSEEKLSETTQTLVKIFTFTFAIEVIGFLSLYISKFGLHEKISLNNIFESLFYSIISFGNAGFSLSSNGLIDDFNNQQYPFIFIIMILSFLGSTGFPVMINLYNQITKQNIIFKISNKIVLYSHFSLLIAGSIIFYILFYIENGSMSKSLFDSKVLFHSVFLSISTRTAGFNILPTESLSTFITLFCCLLMWIGGSPNSTAGGIKNITFTTAIYSAWNTLLNKKTVLFEREISTSSSMRSFSIILFSLFLIMASSVTIMFLEQKLSSLDVIFEVFSAFGTTGLSRGITAQLSDTSKIILMINMIIGRVGLFTFFGSLIFTNKKNNINYLKENISIQ